MQGVDQEAIPFPLGGAAQPVVAGFEAADERAPALPNVGSWTVEEGDASMRVTIVHSGFGGAAQAACGVPKACGYADRRVLVTVLGRSSLYLALVG